MEYFIYLSSMQPHHTHKKPCEEAYLTKGNYYGWAIELSFIEDLDRLVVSTGKRISIRKSGPNSTIEIHDDD